MRRVFAVLVLAAVVAMHGTPALGTDGVGRRGALVETTVAASSGIAGAHSVDQPDALARSWLLPAPPVTPGHEASHVWAACLAVLLTALTLLVAAVGTAQRAGPLLRGPVVRQTSRWTVPPRPPDLSALCLLRV